MLLVEADFCVARIVELDRLAELLPWGGAETAAQRELRRTVPYGLPDAGGSRRWLNRARLALVERDGARCAVCDWSNPEWVMDWRVDRAQWFPLYVDHVVALADGGLHSLANMQLLCTDCHRAKTSQEKAARPCRLTKVEKMAALEAAGWTRLGAKAASVRRQWWKHPETRRGYRLDAACRIEGVEPR